MMRVLVCCFFICGPILLGWIGGGLLVFLWAQQFSHCGEKKNPLQIVQRLVLEKEKKRTAKVTIF
jgi:hypothetical protein